MIPFDRQQKFADRIAPSIHSERSELESYLNYYNQLRNPGYAVLITGQWGTGKTHQTKSAIGEDSYYISLFGLSSAEEIYATVFAKMYPNKARMKSFGRQLQELGVEFAGTKLNIGGLATGVINAIIREQVSSDKTLIFDDLERSSIPITDRLGVINKYVEHHGCRVVVLAHDDKLTDEFLSAKEKIFGHSIAVTPQRQAAFEYFIEKYTGDPEAYGFLANRRKLIIDIMIQSGCESLRILKRTLEDLTRIYDALDARHRANDEALSTIAEVFVAFSLGVRSGLLKRADIANRSRASTAYHLRLYAGNKDTVEKPAIVQMIEKHPTLNLTSNILNDEVLEAMLFQGSFEAENIRNSLDNSLSYRKPSELSPWLAFMHFDDMADPDSEMAAERLIKQFMSREVEEPGEMLHVFAFMFLLARIGVRHVTIEDTLAECKQYLDELVASGRMTRLGGKYHDLGRAYGGYGYWVEDIYRSHFNELIEYLIESGNRAMRDSYPAISKELLRLMQDDSSALADKLGHGNATGESYARVDVLQSIEPEEFVSCFMNSHPVNWRNISQALRNRYEHGGLNGALHKEAPWIIQVIDLLEEEKVKSAPVRRLRIERAVPWELKALAQAALSSKQL